MAKEKDDISIDKENQGKFTAWVKKNMPGKSTCAAASAVMKKKKKFSSDVVKMANYANNFGCKMEGKGKKDSPANLTAKQRKLPEFIQKAILAKQKGKDSASKMTGPGGKGSKSSKGVGPFSKHNMSGKIPERPKSNEETKDKKQKS